MKRGLALLSILVCFFVVLRFALAQEWWETKAPEDWSNSDVEQVLQNSSWVQRAKGGFIWMMNTTADARHDPIRPTAVPTAPAPVAAQPQMEFGEGRSYPICYQVRLLTARPMRDAYLRLLVQSEDIVSAPGGDTSVSIEELIEEEDGQAESVRLARFVESNPDDIRAAKDEEHIILSMTVAAFFPKQQKLFHQQTAIQDRASRFPSFGVYWQWTGWWEDAQPQNLVNIRLADIAEKTFLKTKTGKRVYVERYLPPGVDNLGAKFFFPRMLPDGTPLVTMKDKELRFETRIPGRKIAVKFKIEDLLYKGRLEF